MNETYFNHGLSIDEYNLYGFQCFEIFPGLKKKFFKIGAAAGKPVKTIT